MSDSELVERTPTGNKHLDEMMEGGPLNGSVTPVSYTHLTLPTIYSV